MSSRRCAEEALDCSVLGALDPAYELATLYLNEFLRMGAGGGA